MIELNKRIFFNSILFLSLIVWGGCVSVMLGSPLCDWDALNYHIYAPYAFLTGRIGFDILPCGIRSYFNPIMDIPYYIMLKYLNHHPYIVSFIQGSYYGIFMYLSYKISELIFIKDSYEKYMLSIFSTVIIGSSAFILYEIGTLFGDIQSSILICLALYLCLKYLFYDDSSKCNWIILLMGFILGAVLGLKLNSIAMIIGLFIAFLFNYKKFDKPLNIILYSAIGFIIGFFIVNGYWYWLIYSHFKNPFFPLYNNIFRSPYGPFYKIAEHMYTYATPHSFNDKLLYPFLFIKQYFNKGFGSWSIPYVDWRYPLIAFAVIYMIFKSFINRKKQYEIVSKEKVDFLLIFFIASYVIWLNLFPIVRFIFPLIVVGCILMCFVVFDIASSINKLFKDYSVVKYITTLSMFIFLTAIIAKSTNIDIYMYEKRQDLKDNLLEVENLHFEDGALVLLASQKTSALFINQNSKARYVYLMAPKEVPLKPTAFACNNRFVDYYHSDYYQSEIKKLINKSKNTYLIFLDKEASKEFELYENSLKYYLGSKPFFEGCKVVKTKPIPEYGNKYWVCNVSNKK